MFQSFFSSVASFFKTLHLGTLHLEVTLSQSLAEAHDELKQTREDFKLSQEDVTANLDFIDSMCGYKKRAKKKD